MSNQGAVPDEITPQEIFKAYDIRVSSANPSLAKACG